MKFISVSRKATSDKMENAIIEQMLLENSRKLYGFTKSEFDSLVEFDLLNIMAFFYSKMDANQKVIICDSISETMELSDMEDEMDDLAYDFEDENDLYIPLSCKLVDGLGDSRYTKIVFETLFTKCKEMTLDMWNQGDSYSNYLVLLNAGYFTSLSQVFHITDSCSACIKEYYGQENYDDFVESLYETHKDDIDWDEDVELDVIDELLDASNDYVFDESDEEDYSDAVERINEIRLEHYKDSFDEEDGNGFERIVENTGIREKKAEDICGFECHFCLAKQSEDEYIIVYQKGTKIRDIIDDDEKWKKFQHDLYYADIKNSFSKSMVYIVYILDKDSDNIPIQIIESNKTYGRKYVFTEGEAITFINGIVKTSYEEVNAVSPVQEWDKILREEHLTGCLTELYSSKKVEAYISGDRFDADYIMDDDYSSLTRSVIPEIKWIKSLDTYGFRDFCFDNKTMEFGQINLFYGANGSGKTSVLEAIEYALTSEVRRVKDFKVKLPSDNFPSLYVYDKEAGVHKFSPNFSKKNNKEIERVWYGVPVGRTKSTLNDNFNRFNSFDSEAAYKFIHESDNSQESFSSMFGNLMFGESIVDHEKKWQRYKRAFGEKYAELREELGSAKYWEQVYEESLSQDRMGSKSEEIEEGLEELKFQAISKLPKSTNSRYQKVMEILSLVRKYVDVLDSYELFEDTFGKMISEVTEDKRNNQRYVKEKKEKSDEITKLVENNGELKKYIFDEREKQEDIQDKIDFLNEEIEYWNHVQNVLNHEDTVKLVYDLYSELTELDKELLSISKIEQRTAIVSFLKSGQYDSLPINKRKLYEEKYAEIRENRNQIEKKYNEAKKFFGEKEQQTIELRKIGKTLISGTTCPLCGMEYESTKKLLDIIDSAVVVDEGMDSMISEIENMTKEIMELEKILDQEKLIEKAKDELSKISDKVPAINLFGSNYKGLYNYIESKDEKDKRKEEILEQQETLDSQGFSLNSINECKEYKSTNPTYLEFVESGAEDYSIYLNDRLKEIINENNSILSRIDSYQKKIQQNNQKEELLRNDIRGLDSMIEALDMEENRELEQAIENIKTKFDIQDNVVMTSWISKYYDIYDRCEYELERIEKEGTIAFERGQLESYKKDIKRLEPKVVRCANAVRAFEKMPSLSSFVEKGIKGNIQQISKFFKWMHHSGEFEELGIDSDGIYAIRGLNHQKIRTYEMSTGQRATIAMSVMFALHLAAPNAPQFLLLDEPLATMDDTQVLNVLDILKSMAEQKTQIFFTTANGIMIDLFKQTFKNTDFDYKEYEFIKRVNRPSEIKESSINDTKTIEELTLDDLTLDFAQFAEIRETLRKNQEKLVSKDEWELFGSEKVQKQSEESINNEREIKDNFFSDLSNEEINLLNILIDDDGLSASKIQKKLSVYPTFKIMLEKINEKAIDFFGETIVENDDEHPWIEDDYKEELESQRDKYFSN